MGRARIHQFSFLVFLLCWVGMGSAYAQLTQVQGRVLDANTGEAIPFASVLFTGSSVGTTTDFDGYYTLKSAQAFDSISFSYIGYQKITLAIQPGTSQQLNVKLTDNAISLREVVVTPGRRKRTDDPAYPIMEKVLEHKEKHNKNSLQAYEYEVYNKVELDLQRLPDRLQKQKVVQKVQATFDSVHDYRNDSGEKLLPVFLSESISRFHARKNPDLTQENILQTNMRGIGLEDGSFLSQLVGASFQEYNFYENWLNILEKQFVSPLADGWKLYYNYELQDSLMLEGTKCYKIRAWPRREQDLAFFGTLWITAEDYALKQIDVQVLPEANLNFVHKIAISQQLIPTGSGAWLVQKNRTMLDVRQPGEQGTGFLAKFYTSIKDVKVNQPHEPNFYEAGISVVNKKENDTYWQLSRHDSLSAEELKVAQMIDSANQLPIVKRTVGLVKALTTGHVKLSNKFDIGPYPLFYTFNEVEGHRLAFGLRTTSDFSKRYRLKAFGAYGTRDNRFKYRFELENYLSRKNWTKLSLSHSRDLAQVGLDVEELASENPFFYAANQWGSLNLPYMRQYTRIQLQSDLHRGVIGKVGVSHRHFSPNYPFYYQETSESPIHNEFETIEVSAQLRLSKNETYLQDNFNRISTGTKGWPVLTMSYAYGVPNFLGSDFEYHRVQLEATQKLKLAFLGVSRYSLEAGKYFGDLPYPMLQVHLGNESLFYTSAAFNLMNVAEFASDSYVSLRYMHYFEGFLLNSIPLIKKLKWRAVAHASVLWGDLSKENEALVVTPPFVMPDSNYIRPASLNEVPYIEVGYGIENIFKFIRIDAFHRLTYLDRPDVSKFGVKVSFAFML